MIASLLLLVGLAPVSFGADVNWKSDYAEATKLAKNQNKPVLVYFKNSKGAATNGTEIHKQDIAVDQRLLDPFVLVMADRSTPAGEKLFKIFEMTSDHGVVVVERELNWQFCRYERQLESNELAEVLRETSTATGKPVNATLASVPATKSVGERTSFYPPSESGTESVMPSVNWTMPQAGSCPNCRRFQ